MPETHDEEHAEPAPQLAALSFLTGRFRGEGHLADGGERYEKDVTGKWVAGGHHLLLEMTARYSDGRGRRDDHSSIVLVSAGDDTSPTFFGPRKPKRTRSTPTPCWHR